MGQATSSNSISYGPSRSFLQFSWHDCYIVENDVKSQAIRPSLIVTLCNSICIFLNPLYYFSLFMDIKSHLTYVMSTYYLPPLHLVMSHKT